MDKQYELRCPKCNGKNLMRLLENVQLTQSISPLFFESDDSFELDDHCVDEVDKAFARLFIYCDDCNYEFPVDDNEITEWDFMGIAIEKGWAKEV